IDRLVSILGDFLEGDAQNYDLVKRYLNSKDGATFLADFLNKHESDILKAQQDNDIPFVQSTCPNDGYTERADMKKMLAAFYTKYPMAKSNFLYMLHNEEQVELWQREDKKSEN
ncbi:MAG: tRNA 2-thiocytidine(32) synthetase TtcA, partial [Longicatena sp.]